MRKGGKGEAEEGWWEVVDWKGGWGRRKVGIDTGRGILQRRFMRIPLEISILYAKPQLTHTTSPFELNKKFLKKRALALHLPLFPILHLISPPPQPL